jgi:hypothetical protein
MASKTAIAAQPAVCRNIMTDSSDLPRSRDRAVYVAELHDVVVRFSSVDLKADCAPGRAQRPGEFERDILGRSRLILLQDGYFE